MNSINALVLSAVLLASGSEVATKVNLGYCQFNVPSGFSLDLYRSAEPLVFARAPDARGSELFGVLRQTNEEFLSDAKEGVPFGLERLEASGELEMYEYVPIGPIGMPGTKVIRVSGQWSVVFGADLDALRESIFEQCLETLR